MIPLDELNKSGLGFQDLGRYFSCFKLVLSVVLFFMLNFIPQKNP